MRVAPVGSNGSLEARRAAADDEGVSEQDPAHRVRRTPWRAIR
jgi:hypothetical protein